MLAVCLAHFYIQNVFGFETTMKLIQLASQALYSVDYCQVSSAMPASTIGSAKCCCSYIAMVLILLKLTASQQHISQLQILGQDSDTIWSYSSLVENTVNGATWNHVRSYCKSPCSIQSLQLPIMLIINIGLIHINLYLPMQKTSYMTHLFCISFLSNFFCSCSFSYLHLQLHSYSS